MTAPQIKRADRQRLETIDRRIAHLGGRIADWKGAGEPHYARAELGALKWARSIVRMYLGLDKGPAAPAEGERLEREARAEEVEQ